ncbi:hypothetical protein BGC30_10580 [Novacetimonas hansenii]|nr:hypothetical protein BGC30_10580 [Novacetimonas hansenii]
MGGRGAVSNEWPNNMRIIINVNIARRQAIQKLLAAHALVILSATRRAAFVPQRSLIEIMPSTMPARYRIR